jgi:chorismate dehydratase
LNSLTSKEQLTRLDLPRVGQINFSNCLPINLPIELGRVAIEANLIDGTPSELNNLIAAGNLEVSSGSSFLYLSRQDLTLLPDLSISCFGPVGSVLFFSKCKPDQLAGGKIAVPRASATSIRLVSLMLALEYGVTPELVVQETPQISDRQSGDGDNINGALVIGDEALKVDPEWSSQNHRIDLGEWWTKHFSLPMVFGVFVARTEFREQFPDRYRHVSERLREARELGTTELLDQVIDRAVAMTGLSKQRMETYFVDNLNWNLDEKHRESLDLFAKLLRQHNLL